MNKTSFDCNVTVIALTCAALLTSACTIVVSEAAAQNSSISSNGTMTTNTGSANQNKTTITVSGGKPIITISNPSTANSSAAAYNKTGFTSLNILSVNGKNFPIKYSIKGGKIVGMLADKDRTTLVLVLNPGKDGGNMTIELPRNIIDSKGPSNSDAKYQIKIDGKGVDYKEIANNANGRILYISFSKDNRFMELIGTVMKLQ